MEILIIVFAILYGWSDRFSGGGFGWEKLKWDGGGFLRGRPLYYATLVLLIAFGVLGHFMGNLYLTLLPLPWIIWRSPGWKILGGRIDPRGAKEIFGTFCRHLLIVPFYGMAVVNGWLNIEVVYAATIWAAIATLLACYNASQYDKGRDANALVETLRGAIFGALLAVSFLMF